MARRDDQHQGLLIQRDGLDVRMPQRPHHRELDFFAEEHLQHIFGMTGPDGDFDPWVRPGKSLEKRGQNVGAHRRGGAQYQTTR